MWLALSCGQFRELKSAVENLKEKQYVHRRMKKQQRSFTINVVLPT